jgi:hypothetical protein
MKTFISKQQISLWHKSVRPAGPVSVVKKVERDLGLIYEVKKSGDQKLKGPLDLGK